MAEPIETLLESRHRLVRAEAKVEVLEKRWSEAQGKLSAIAADLATAKENRAVRRLDLIEAVGKFEASLSKQAFTLHDKKREPVFRIFDDVDDD